jgi:hypothetical protein
VLVAAAAQDRWRRSEWLGGWLAGLAAAGRALPVLLGGLLLVEAAVDWAGLGRLMLQAAELRVAPPTSIVVILLTLALAGQLAGAAGDVLARELPDATATPDPPGRTARAGLVASVCALGLPLVLLLAALPATTPAVAVAPAGGDLTGRLLVGLRTTVAIAFGAALLATLAGGAWGLAAAAARRAANGASRVAGELVAASAWILALMPAVPAVLLLVLATRGQPSTVLLLALVLAPRLALGAQDVLAEALPARTMLRAAAGTLLLCLGLAVVLQVGTGALGLGPFPPAISLGGLAGENLNVFASGNLGWVALLTMATAGPCLSAGWTLLRPFRAGRARAWAILEA